MRRLTSRGRAGLVALLMLVTAMFSVFAVPDESLADARRKIDLEASVPRHFGAWRVDPTVIPLPPSPDQDALMSRIYEQVLSRTYVNGRGERVMLSMTYGSRQTQQLRAHRQEVCYRAQGFNVSGVQRSSSRVLGAEVPLTRMVAQLGPRVEPVTYWFTMGDRVVLTYLDREAAQFKYLLSGYVPDGFLVRLSSLNRNADQAFSQHLAFAEELLREVDPELRARLIGSGL
jgi:EpsI family protein